jgi:enterochelin esterase-like enzyme
MIYLPGSYAADKSRRFPLFQMESGFTGSYHTWKASAGLQANVDNLIADGRLPAVVVVMPEQYPILGRDSECVNADPAVLPGSLADTYLSHDVPLYMRTHYRIGAGRSDLMIGGFSTGGYCAANLALRHSSTYGGAMVLSGYFRTIIDHTTGPLFADRAEAQANDAMITIRRPHRPLAWFLSAAQDAPTDVRYLAEFQRLVPRTDLLHVVYTRTGGHSSAAWRVSSRLGFAWLASVFARQ